MKTAFIMIALLMPLTAIASDEYEIAHQLVGEFVSSVNDIKKLTEDEQKWLVESGLGFDEENMANLIANAAARVQLQFFRGCDIRKAI